MTAGGFKAGDRVCVGSAEGTVVHAFGAVVVVDFGADGIYTNHAADCVHCPAPSVPDTTNHQEAPR